MSTGDLQDSRSYAAWTTGLGLRTLSQLKQKVSQSSSPNGGSIQQTTVA